MNRSQSGPDKPLPLPFREGVGGRAALEVLLIFLRLGCTSFGGPVAHIGYFRSEFVQRRRWLPEGSFADLVALCQFMPGPASSQLGMSIGLLRAGPLGMLAAWVGFTLPSALLMLAFAYGVEALGDVSNAAWLKGLKLVAVAVVAQAVWGMAQNLAPDRPRATVAVAAALIALAVPSSVGQIAAIVFGALAGLTLLPKPALTADADHVPLGLNLHRGVAVVAIILFFALLAVPAAARRHHRQPGTAAVRRILSCRRVGIWRRPRGAATAAGSGGSNGLGHQRRIPRRLWRSTGDARAALHLQCLSRRGDDPAAKRRPRRAALRGGDLRTFVPAGDRADPVLGYPAPTPGHAGDAARRERRRGRRAAGGALYARMDIGRAFAGRLRPRARRLACPHALGGVALDCGRRRRAGRGRPWCRSASDCDQPGIFGNCFISPPRCTQGCALSQ